MAKGLYQTLGVSRSASANEIKRAYRKLAKKYHPDTSGGKAGAAERFKEVSAAFEVLGDPDRRKLFDEFGDDSLRPGFDAKQARAYQKWSKQSARDGGGPWQGVGMGGAGAGSGFEDLFGDLFGARGGPMQRVQNTARSLEIDLATAMRGGTLKLSLDQQVECPQCHGRGAVGRSKRSVCMACQGQGHSVERQELSVRIPPRAPDGSVLKIKGHGGKGRGGRVGDLRLEIRIQPDPVYRREGKDLHVELPITVDEAVLGGKVSIETPDGRNLTVRVEPGSQSGQALRLKGQGLGSGTRAGNLIATLSIKVPRQGGEEAARALREAYQDEVSSKPRAA